ncbi:hydrogenase maturation nickel metallochaperone HypA [Flavobacteriaceae bacterium]|jgi:hydrogenase nickel incorporation protein HypA/HybF|nr:hydrogenase maturation nickel metallochaperone HypA [Flavobacteriaceae bacterium]MDA9368641.1 hydrogenase maturation nickel metallochaperone HypA [Flavobacteriaceae bacterium]MDA9879337.1 hydrogenase maturation nickel metallochaperone HypA [Flavobacteriaceae bacterium]MDB4171810.1 hydrogenase maturation nickel metallochaperone HypA [Flavobacteriaceae bacterium]MDB9903335.1 hydrogenase maturation nickel metallochaperone HypA [Flavobacteriaceae bacterium]|tara:strand:+ start:200 stop:547 length:348 start_codon:yes stop_codon:yes gene_type:complete
MHETSIVNSIIRTLEQEFEAEKLNKMKSIHLKVGILSNIEPRLLYNAYDASHMMNPKYQNVKLEIEMTELKIQCEVCDHITDVQKYRFICDNCQKPSKNVIQGEEMLIHKVEFND